MKFMLWKKKKMLHFTRPSKTVSNEFHALEEEKMLYFTRPSKTVSDKLPALEEDKKAAFYSTVQNLSNGQKLSHIMPSLT